MIKKRKRFKSIKNFIIVFVISFLVMEVIEYLIHYYLRIDLYQLEWGWVGFIIIYGFKWHIFCCLFPFLYTSYKCRHKNKCNHQHCD